MERLYQNRDWLYEEYLVKNRTIKSISEEFHVSHQIIEKYLKRYGLRKVIIERMPTPEEIRELHVNQGRGIQSIASMYPGVGEGTILRIMKENGIEVIPPAQLHSMWWAKEENKAVMSEMRLALWQDDEYRKKTDAHLKNKATIMDRAIKFSAKYQGIPIEEWKGFLTPEQTRIRHSEEYSSWRKKVFQRDNYTCQCCGARSHAGHPVNLHAHHLENFAHNEALRFDVNNGITLCYDCHDIRAHGSFHNLYGIHNNSREQFEDYIRYRRSNGRNVEKHGGENDEVFRNKRAARVYADAEPVL